MTSTPDFIASGIRTIRLETNAVAQLETAINGDFTQACSLMMSCSGRVVVTGMGKSGHIGNKIAATLASTGTPAFFVHPGEASHGDLGMITPQDVVLALSNSGTTAEVLTILPLIKRMGAPLISMTGVDDSPLAQQSDVHIHVPIEEEACPLDLAPTSSTTATLVMGDALAIALLEARGFSQEDFAFSHPGGALGRKLLLKVQDLMHADQEVPMVQPDTPLAAALVEMTEKKLGMTTVVNEQGGLAGIFTDGDLRRALDRQLDVHTATIDEVMTRHCRTVTPNQLAAEAVRIMEDNKILVLVVVDDANQPVGALNMHDLLRAGVL